MTPEQEEMEATEDELTRTLEVDESTGVKTRFVDTRHTYFSWHDNVRGHYATGITRKIAIKSYFDSILDIVSSLNNECEELQTKLNEMTQENSEIWRQDEDID